MADVALDGLKGSEIDQGLVCIHSCYANLFTRRIYVLDFSVRPTPAVLPVARPTESLGTDINTSGSGLHMHISLLDEDGNNVFAGESKHGPWSDTLRHAIGGMSEAMAESMALFAINANSYRRYGMHSYVPSTPNWGPNHRDLALRIPLSSPKNSRVEHRVSGADANPFLVAAAIFAGMHHGISNKVEPGTMIQEREPVDDEVTLPTRWPLALDAFDKGKILPRYFGKDYHELYGICRREESDRFESEVSDIDYEWYCRAVEPAFIRSSSSFCRRSSMSSLLYTEAAVTSTSGARRTL